ncbi:MAG: NUDIX hydrolase [bacterium]
MHEKTISAKVVFKGRLLTVEVLDVELENGVRTVREVVRHSGAVGVLAQLPDSSFVLVRQFRKPLECELIEIVAGGMEPGELPEDCAVRETREETGYETASVEKLGVVALAPGYSSEQLHLFYAKLAQAGDVCPDPDEYVQVVRLMEAEIDGMIGRNEIKDAKTVAAWYLWKARLK